MKTLISRTALLFATTVTTLASAAAGMPAAAPVSGSCGMQAPAQTGTPERSAEQRARQRMHLLPRECGLVDSDKEINQYVNTGVSKDDPWQKADDLLELSRHYNGGGEHEMSSPAAQHLRLDAGGRGAADTALMHDAVPSVPEPSSVMMTAAGLLLLGGWTWRLRRRARLAAAAR
jgi:hypothetical protein